MTKFYIMMTGALMAVFFSPLGSIGLFLGVSGLVVSFLTLLIILCEGHDPNKEEIEAKCKEYVEKATFDAKAACEAYNHNFLLLPPEKGNSEEIK